MIALGLAMLAVSSGGAGTAASTNALTLSAPDVNNRITAFTAPSGRLTLTSPEGFTNPPPSPGGECIQDSPTQVSCNPGFIGVILGTLGGGDDSFDGTGLIDVRTGDLAGGGVRRPLSGGTGNDRIIGSGGPDLLDGAAGVDALIGGGGEDLMTGAAGRDRLNGGAAPDVLHGGGGRDKFNGGGAKDGCSGGGGRDAEKSCEFLKSIP
jgi:Ca2+-binding RTX toxin-like protein